MKKIIILLSSLVATILFMLGCSSEDIKDFNIEEIAINEARKIASEQGYTLKSETFNESMLGDSEIFEFMKNASIEGGYSEDNFDSDSDRTYVDYELVEKSKLDLPITLGLIIDTENGKVTGAYLDHSGYSPGIEPINFKDNFK